MGCAALMALAGCVDATGNMPDSVSDIHLASFMPIGQQVVPPFGFIDFCLRESTECAGGTDNPSTPVLTAKRWSDLNAVNDFVNGLPEIEDSRNYGRSEYWTYPNERGGDCEDLALLKRRMLMERGWPADSLLIAVAAEVTGERHAVLIVVTDHGELVLDNKNWAILAWTEAPYKWVKRQSRERPYIWVNLDAGTFRNEHAKLPPLGAPAPFVVAARLVARKTGAL